MNLIFAALWASIPSARATVASIHDPRHSRSRPNETTECFAMFSPIFFPSSYFSLLLFCSPSWSVHAFCRMAITHKYGWSAARLNSSRNLIIRRREIAHTRRHTHQIQFRHGTPVWRERLWWAPFDRAAAQINQNIYEIKRERESMHVFLVCILFSVFVSWGLLRERARARHDKIEKNKCRNNKLSTVHFGRAATQSREWWRWRRASACTMLCSLI